MTPGFNEHAQSRRVVEQHFGEGFIRTLSTFQVRKVVHWCMPVAILKSAEIFYDFYAI
jgi:hypothetical protein